MSEEGSDAYVETAIARLRSAGLRITRSRVKLLTELSKRDEPISIEELHHSIGEKDCDLVTVYRCMSAFENHDVVRRSHRHGGATLYERKLGEPPRYRVVCRLTNGVEEIEPEAAIRLEEAIRQVERSLRKRGYSHVSHALEFSAVRGGIGTTADGPSGIQRR